MDGFVDLADLSFIETGIDNDRLEEGARQDKLSPNQLVMPEDFFDLEGFTRGIIQQTLDKFQGNQRKASEYLGISRRQLQGRINKWGLGQSRNSS